MRLKILKDYIKNNKNIFISGIGGVGKSYLIKEIFNYIKSDLEKNVALTSTTGISAYNISGVTIHKWSGLILPSTDVKDPETFIKKCLRKIYNEKPLLKKWKNINTIIIDEISMLGGTYLHFLNIIARELRADKRPFGGIQIIASGDMLQLPPVKDIFPFEAPIWNDLKFINIVLTKAYRFENQDWTDCLQRIRLQKTTTSDIKLLKECADRYKKIFNSDNEDSEPGSMVSGHSKAPIKPTILCPVNSQVDLINNQELEKIDSTLFTYNSIDICGYLEKNSPHPSKDEIDFSKFKKCSIDEIEFLDKELIVPSTINLKIGAQVMLLLNIDVELGLVNGSRGIVQRCEETVSSKAVWVLFENHSEPIKVEYQKCHLIEDFEGKVYLRTMLPLKLAWAYSFHKAQGSTLESAVVNCGRGIFTEGQAYVALSRVRNSDNLYLSEFFPSKITTNKKALTFEQNMLKNCIFIDSLIYDESSELEPTCPEGILNLKEDFKELLKETNKQGES